MFQIFILASFLVAERSGFAGLAKEMPHPPGGMQRLLRRGVG
jgi:hypothetical protein